MMSWGKIWTSMDQIGMTEEEKNAICHVLAAIYHLGVAGAIKGMEDEFFYFFFYLFRIRTWVRVINVFRTHHTHKK